MKKEKRKKVKKGKSFFDFQRNICNDCCYKIIKKEKRKKVKREEENKFL